MSLFVGSALAACGGDDGPSDGVDAPVVIIDAASPDAPTAIMGLGQACTQPTDCPTNAPACVGFQGTPMYCTPLCLENATGTTNAMGQFASLTPMPDNAACAAAFTGTVGMPACGAILATTPADNPLQPNKEYTGVSGGCVVACGASNACPTGMTANTSLGACLCFPG